jgi:hypothetical protein
MLLVWFGVAGLLAVVVLLILARNQHRVDDEVWEGPLAGHDAADARDQLAVWAGIEPDHAPGLVEEAARRAFRSAHPGERVTVTEARVVAFEDSGHPVVRIDAAVGGPRSGESLIEYWEMRHTPAGWQSTGSVDEETGTTRYLTG